MSPERCRCGQGVTPAAADFWLFAAARRGQPTRARYLGRVSKSLVLEALTEAVSLELADAYRERKRDGLIDAAERKLAGTRWLPALLRQPVMPAEDAEIAEPGNEVSNVVPLRAA